MKRVVVLLISLALISSFFGCMQGTGEMTYEGVYVKTENGQHILTAEPMTARNTTCCRRRRLVKPWTN